MSCDDAGYAHSDPFGGTWTCMVCGDERPDADISVHTVVGGGRFEVQVNVRYCNDRPACGSAAPGKAAEMLARMGLTER